MPISETFWDCIVSRADRSLTAYIQLWVVVLGLLSTGWPAFALPPDLTGLGYQLRPGVLLPLDRQFQTETKHLANLRSLINHKPAILILGYYACPSLCGVIRNDALSAISRTRLVAGRDYRLLFLSIDAAETPAMAASAKGTDQQEYPSLDVTEASVFLTARQPDIDAVENAVGFHARYSSSLKQFLHPAGIVIVAPDGRVSSYLLGVSFSPLDVEKALNAASRDRIERSDNPIVLLCFHYDASVGRYSLDVIKLLRLAGAITICGTLLLVYAARRRNRQRLLNKH